MIPTNVPTSSYLSVQIVHCFELLSAVGTDVSKDLEPFGLLVQFIFVFFDAFVQVMQAIVAVVCLVFDVNLRARVPRRITIKLGRWLWTHLVIFDKVFDNV